MGHSFENAFRLRHWNQCMRIRRTALLLGGVALLAWGVYAPDRGAIIFGFFGIFSALFWYVFGSIIEAGNRATN